MTMAHVLRILLLATVGAYLCVVVAYGHAALPLGMGVPVVVAEFQEADTEILVPSLLGVFGAMGALLACFFPQDTRLFAVSLVISLLLLVASVSVFITLSDARVVSLLSAIPFAGFSVATMVLLLWRQPSSIRGA